MAILVATISLTGFKVAILHVDTFTVDTKSSTLEWYATKFAGKHNGKISLSRGQLSNDHGNITGFVEIDMKSLTNSDIENEKSRTKLETHLKSADFFDVEKYPVSKFVIKSVIAFNDTSEEKMTHKVTGDLTIKDKTNEITFGSRINLFHDSVVCSGSAIVDRSKFDVRYGSKTFFKDIGDKVIHDDFRLVFNLVAKKQ
jgi:polyisoprenoid-binding protein YceI